MPKPLPATAREREHQMQREQTLQTKIARHISWLMKKRLGTELAPEELDPSSTENEQLAQWADMPNHPLSRQLCIDTIARLDKECSRDPRDGKMMTIMPSVRLAVFEEVKKHHQNLISHERRTVERWLDEIESSWQEG